MHSEGLFTIAFVSSRKPLGVPELVDFEDGIDARCIVTKNSRGTF